MTASIEGRYRTTIRSRAWLSPRTFSLTLDRPRGFAFTPGQSISVGMGGTTRDYSIASGRDEEPLSLCVRLIPTGSLSPVLAAAAEGAACTIEGPHGLFTLRESERPPVFVATGTGIAPFVSMARTGCRGFSLFHGVRSENELCFQDELRPAADLYIPCLSLDPRDDAFSGRVTEAAVHHLAPGPYDFYLCGGRAMIRDFTVLADERFPGSRIFMEVFH